MIALGVMLLTGDVGRCIGHPRMPARFQVASQFNHRTIVVMPAQGVTRYQHDHTHGPACAIAAGAATIYRNYFAPVGGSHGQTAHRQIDTLADVGEALSSALKMPVGALWEMENGYALCTRAGLDAITGYLDGLNTARRDLLAGKLRVGVHQDVEVTEAPG